MAVKTDGKKSKMDPKDCTHHWVIDSPNGPQSQGSCKVCGAEREFMNYLESSAWSSGEEKKGDDVGIFNFSVSSRTTTFGSLASFKFIASEY